MFGFKKTLKLSPVEKVACAYSAPDEPDAPLLGKFQQRWFDGDRFLYLECTTGLAGSSEQVECDLETANAFMKARDSCCISEEWLPALSHDSDCLGRV